MTRRDAQRRTDIERLRHCLAPFERDLDRAYTGARVFYEPDVHHWTIVHLQRRLGSGWVDFSKHRVAGIFADVAVHRASTHASKIRLGREEIPWQMPVGVVETRYRASLVNDLRKLASLQRRYARANSPLAWMSSGDHFRPDVHKTNFQGRERRAAEIRSWIVKQSYAPGMSVLRFAELHPNDSPHQRAIRECLIRRWWNRDK